MRKAQVKSKEEAISDRHVGHRMVLEISIFIKKLTLFLNLLHINSTFNLDKKRTCHSLSLARTDTGFLSSAVIALLQLIGQISC
jgi:hypothetical protein